MGTQESANKRGRRKNVWKRQILEVLDKAEIVYEGILRRNVLAAMQQAEAITGSRANRSLRMAEYRLIKARLISKRGQQYRLTPAGRQVVRLLAIKSGNVIKRPSRWDEKWRMLIFDIPQSRKIVRDKVRFLLKKIGFKQLQQSVWVYPYDCEDIVTILKADYGITSHMLYIIADSIEHDAYLREEFGL